MRDRTVAPTVISFMSCIYYYKQPYEVASLFCPGFVTNILSQIFLAFIDQTLQTEIIVPPNGGNLSPS